jgi:histidinol-phosphate phosphatase family domain/HAD-superfamily hydrolase, subfamily IIIA
MINQAIILAGGRGTRLKPFTDEHPKPMIPIQENPFLYYLLEQVEKWGIKHVLLLLGYRAEEIVSFVKELGFELDIKCLITPEDYDTGERISNAKDYIEDDFILLYCDNFCPIDFVKAVEQFKNSDVLIQITAYKNKDGYTKNNLKYDEENYVAIYDKKRTKDGLNGVDIGYAFIKKEAIDLLPEGNLNFEAAVYPQIVERGKMGCFPTEHRYYSIGSWERIELTKEFFREKKIVFLDRDGTLNERPPRACYVEKAEDFKWLPGAIEAVKLLKENGYTIYLISNQPGIARGNLTEEMLSEIHKKMQADLEKNGARIDQIYYCPHNWDEGCECRKPKPGMLFQAQKEHSLDLTKCVLIGDDERDIEAGEAAGIGRNYLVDEQHSLLDIVREII